MPRYIQVNPLKQTWREDLRIAGSWKVIFLWALKLFRQRMPLGSPLPIPVPFEEFIIPADRLIPQAAQKLQVHIAGLPDFSEPVYQEIWTLQRESVTTVATLVHASREIIARVMHLRVGTVHPPQEKISQSLMTRFSDGRMLITSDQPRTYDPDPNVIAQRQLKADLPSLLALHQARLEALRKESAPERLLDDDAVRRVIDRYESEAAERNLRRGLYEEVPVETVQKEIRAEAPPIVGADPTDNLVLAEIEKLRNKRRSWQSAITLALLSLLAFLAIGRFRWNWEFVGLLTAMIVIHELGHYVAMRVFHYSDLRMFFIPLLGAAVTGRHYNVKGWQRAIVYLAGPIPGILLGLILMVVGLLLDLPLLEKAALVALLLNGINLLPFVPLDGGWVLHAILFSRHFILETAFLGMAGVAMIVASSLGQGKFWLYLGLFMLVGLPASYRLARAAGNLRARGVAAASPDNQSIPTETALAILQELKQGPTALRSPRHLARQTLDVFQKLNATPPGTLASIGLLAIYLGAGAASVLGAGIIFAWRLNLFPSVAQQPISKLRLTVDPSQYQVIGTTNDSEFDPGSPAIVSTFTNLARARSVFASARQEIGLGERVALFGQSIFLAAPQQSQRWLDWFDSQGGESFIEMALSNSTGVAELVCEAPDEATARELEAECAAYLENQFLRAWPPWASTAGLDDASSKMLARLRHTRRLIYDAQAQVATNAELVRLSKPGSHQTTTAVLERMTKKAALERALQREALQKLAASGDPLLELPLIEAQLANLSEAAESENAAPTTAAWTDSPIWQFGLLPQSRPPANPQAWCAAEGSVHREKNKLRFNYLSFYRTDCGLPALAVYLSRHGCDRFSYNLDEP